MGRRMAHRVVIGKIRHHAMRALRADGLHPGPCRARRHEYLRPVPQQARRPGETAAMIAVRGGDKGQLPEAFPRTPRPQVLQRKLPRRDAQPFPQHAGHRPDGTKALERGEAETRGFILDEQTPHAKPPRQIREYPQRRGRIFRERAVEPPRQTGGGKGIPRRSAPLPGMAENDFHRAWRSGHHRFLFLISTGTGFRLSAPEARACAPVPGHSAAAARTCAPGCGRDPDTDRPPGSYTA